MEIRFYDTVAENLLYNFLNPHFRFTILPSKKYLIEKIQEYCPFHVYQYDEHTIAINTGEKCIKFKLDIEERINEGTNLTMYYLKSFTIA